MKYTKREIKGLPKVKEIVINDLSSYIKLFSDNKYSEYIFRGENTNYFDTISSAFRGKGMPFLEMEDEFKREVFHRLSEYERNNFLAFSQHHGIPTNLIDFTKSPLVALYFACQPFVFKEQDRYDSQNGFVYLMDKNAVNITDIISNDENSNLLEKFIRDEDDTVIKLYKKFSEYGSKQPLKFYNYFKNLNKDYYYYFEDNRHEKRHFFPRYNNGQYVSSFFEPLSYVDTSLIGRIEKKYGEVDMEALTYTSLLRVFLTEIYDNKEFVFWLNCIPPFLYTPYLTFERGRNQQGLFVYQSYLSLYDEYTKAQILAQQRVWPEIVIVIKNKEKILKELDFIGINDKFIYSDYDNIAKYIRGKYQ